MICLQYDVLARVIAERGSLPLTLQAGDKPKLSIEVGFLFMALFVSSTVLYISESFGLFEIGSLFDST